ncbi:hypothetical protein EYF80_009406 [Liparis tanakae]|uniref:Uncharacterized protein n=1 Tax=Liparis tanakae TaxID=230148 RepID=A0A4Z2ISW0_9TELE|nr:hypothetical protein EYF80_009406 [Liparis tanakae]
MGSWEEEGREGGGGGGEEEESPGMVSSFGVDSSVRFRLADPTRKPDPHLSSTGLHLCWDSFSGQQLAGVDEPYNPTSGQTYRSAPCWRCAKRHSPTEDCGSSPATAPPEAWRSPDRTVLLLSCCSSCEIWELVVSLSLVRLACSLWTSSTSWAVSLSLALSSASRLECNATSVCCSWGRRRRQFNRMSRMTPVPLLI